MRSHALVRIGIIAALLLAALSLTTNFSPARAQATPAHIALDVDPVSAGVQTQVGYVQGETNIEVHALVEGTTDGVGAYGLEVTFGAQLDVVSWSDGTFLSSTGRLPGCVETLTDTSADVACATLGAEPAGPTGSGLLAILRFDAVGPGPACITPIDAELATVDGEPIAVTAEGACISIFPEGSTECTNPLLPHDVDVDGDSLTNAEEAGLGTNPCDADTDDDLCTDWAELNEIPSSGGGRDPLNGYDFYDVDRSGRVDAADIGRVRVSQGLSLGMPGYASARDRSFIGPDAWDLGPPDGVIDGIDATAVLAQFGHRCTPDAGPSGDD